MTNNERIEAYFNNELTESDRQQLMQDVNSDASLKSEYQFQQGVIDGIKDYRKKELIARLDDIQIASTGQSLLLKTLGIVGIVSVVTVGTYMWVNQTNDQPLTADAVNNTEQLVAQPEETQEAATTDITKGLTNEDETTTESVVEKTEKEPALASTKDKATPVIPDVIIPEVQEPESVSSVNVDEDLSAPEAMASSTIRLRSSTDVEVRLSKKYNFHYRVKNGGLTLYGSFNESPFEVIELKTNQGINAYLYFKDQFYALANDSEEIKPLLVITDKQLIKELEKRR